MKPEDLVKKLLDEVYTGNGGDNLHGKLPEPEPKYPTITIGEIIDALPAGMGDVIIEIMNAENDTIQMAKRLKYVFDQHAAALEKIGIVPDYAAYMLVEVARQLRGLR